MALFFKLTYIKRFSNIEAYFDVFTGYEHFTNGVRTKKATGDPADRWILVSPGFSSFTVTSPRIVGHKNPSLRNRSPPSSHDFNRSESLPGRLPMSTFVSTNFCSPGWKMYLFLESTLTLEKKTFLDLYRMPLKKNWWDDWIYRYSMLSIRCSNTGCLGKLWQIWIWVVFTEQSSESELFSPDPEFSSEFWGEAGPKNSSMAPAILLEYEHLLGVSPPT